LTEHGPLNVQWCAICENTLQSTQVANFANVPYFRLNLRFRRRGQEFVGMNGEKVVRFLQELKEAGSNVIDRIRIMLVDDDLTRERPCFVGSAS
jgi:hypothetical protein